MKKKINKRTVATLGAALLVCMLACIGSSAQDSTSAEAQQQTDARAGLSEKQKQTITLFEMRAKEYSRQREWIEDQLPKLPKESTPEQIQAHKTAFESRVRAARAGARRGQIFTRDAERYIRSTIKKEFKGKERRELRAAVLEAETKRVPLRVNYTYPESQEMVEMPPTLLLKLPQLPKQLRYRFVGRNMLLVDRENGLIVDYMLKALP
ncbi:MAG TPA: hypothetical protein VGB73_00010 [Pyrinomonadaceae bacterium]|jgi:hypothetical protein